MAKVNPKINELLPPLASEEFAALRANIAEHGVRDPVLVDEEGTVIDGHHRLLIAPDAPCRVVKGLSEAEKQALVFSANFARRNLSPSQKAEVRRRMRKVAKLLKSEDHLKNTDAVIADRLGIDRSTVTRWFTPNVKGHNGSNGRPDARVKLNGAAVHQVIERVQAGESQAQIAADFGVSQQRVSSLAKEQAERRSRETQIQEAVAKLGSDTLGVHHGDFRELGQKIPDASVDLLCTDPPYAECDIPLYGDLAKFAVRVLRPGGWCLAYAGKLYLPKVMNLMEEQLEYGWTFAVVHSNVTKLRKRNFYEGWKPVVGFYKPPLNQWWAPFRDTASGGREKQLHKWQQAVGEAKHFIQALCPEGGVVCDPCCGSGTTCLAAKSLERKWIAFDIDGSIVEKARARLCEIDEVVDA